MFARKLLCKFFTFLTPLVVVLSPYPAFAEIKEIIAEGTYIMGDGETPSVAQERAIVEAKRMAVEQAGTYLESFSEVKNMQLTKDEIRVFAAGIVETSVIDRKRDIVGGDAFKFWVKVRCVVNTDNIQDKHNKLQDSSAMDTLRKVQADYEKATQEINDLKRQLAQATTIQEKRQVRQRIVQNEQSFSATQWFKIGYDYGKKKAYDNAIFAYSKAIQLNPQYTIAYYNRGIAFKDKGQNDLAISDYNQAIQLNPQYTKAYNNRGIEYSNKNQYNLAIADYSKAIQLDPQYTIAYYNRGIAYKDKGQNDLAISDYNQVIQINPQYTKAYNNRGNAYKNKGQNDLAISDYNQAIRLNPQYTIAYYNRGIAYRNKGQYNLAIADYNKAIQLDPQYTNAYYGRGVAYNAKGQYDLAISDYNNVIQLNPKYAYAYYARGNTLAKLGRNQEAISSFRLFLKYATPGDSWIEKGKQQIKTLGGSI